MTDHSELVARAQHPPRGPGFAFTAAQFNGRRQLPQPCLLLLRARGRALATDQEKATSRTDQMIAIIAAVKEENLITLCAECMSLSTTKHHRRKSLANLCQVYFASHIDIHKLLA